MFYAYHTRYDNGVGTSNIFFDANSPDKSYQLIDPVLDVEIGKAGSFSFTIPNQNVEYDNFSDLVSYVDVYRENEIDPIFSGRVFGTSKDFNNHTSITCEGLLALFNDSVQRPQQYGNGTDTGVTLETLIRDFINVHNMQVDEYKRIRVGKITVTDDYIYRLYENTETTMTRLNDIVDIYGGYMSVRRSKSDGLLYFDYIAEYTEQSDQIVNFGSNLLDLTQESNIDGFITVIIPYGKEIEKEDGSREKVNIRSVNDGFDYLENSELVSKYGKIVGVVEWDDVEDPSNLKRKAAEYLSSVSNRPIVSINVTAVDMAKANSNINYFHIGQLILVMSQYHNIARYILAERQQLHLLNPANNKMTLGDTIVGFVGQTKNTSNNFYNNIVNNTTAINNLSMKVADIEQGEIDSITSTEIDNMFL